MNKTVLITGASSGIGYGLAVIFVANNYNIVMVAKDQNKLEAAAATLKSNTNTIITLAADLALAHAPDEVFKTLQSKNITIDILINNAGFASYGLFTENDLKDELAELQVNIVTLTHLTKLYARDMLTRKSGRILNVASTAAFLPGPLMAVYYASKAYVLSFSEALAEEMRGTGVTVSALCPGPTDTGFVKRAHLERSKLFQGENMQASEVAEIAYNGLLAGRAVIIPGLQNKFLTSVIKFVPRTFVPKIVKQLQEKSN
ncbi:MAG: SDR family oxidoreductase [Candidatus Levybacteria bacterium]|nr:SDR family oxidoreductase [Candidatus Levybacteria bacterium]